MKGKVKSVLIDLLSKPGVLNQPLKHGLQITES